MSSGGGTGGTGTESDEDDFIARSASRSRTADGASFGVFPNVMYGGGRVPGSSGGDLLWRCESCVKRKRRKDRKKAHLSSDSGSSSAITSPSKAPPLLATVFCTAFAAMLFLAFSSSELRYSCEISSSPSSSELSSPSDSGSDSEDECSDEDGPEDEDDAEGEGEVSLHSTESEGSDPPFPFSWAESVILASGGLFFGEFGGGHLRRESRDIQTFEKSLFYHPPSSCSKRVAHGPRAVSIYR